MELGIDLTDWAAVKLTDYPKDERPVIKARRKRLQEKKKLMQLRGWVGHPAREIWRGHEKALAYYGLLICQEWASRGYEEATAPKIAAVASEFAWTSWPDWMEDPEVHRYMRQSLRYKEVVDNANLVAQSKSPIWWYRNQWPDIEPIYGYIWSEDNKRKCLQVPEEQAILSIDWLEEDEISKATRKILAAA
tara:strand:- start:5474 stop:6046 length:573 start_codon:yes stop_codon:yes gene_type:complete